MPGTCSGVACAWSVSNATLPTSWVPGAGEVAPDAATDRSASGMLALEVRGATRAGTFYFSSAQAAPIPPARRAVFSAWVRAEGDVARLPLLLRETGFAGAAQRPEEGDTVVGVAASPTWTFVSFAWTPRHPDSTGVGIALRGELDGPGSGLVAFADPYFGDDATTWTLDDATTPFARGPRAGLTLPLEGAHVVRARRPDGRVQEYALDHPEVGARLARLDALPSPTLPGGVRFVAARVEHGLQPELLVNGDFRQGVTGWGLAPWERGRAATLVRDGSSLRMRVAAAPDNGSAWLAQGVAWTPGVPFELVWRAHDDRGLARYEVIVLESDGTRHASRAAAGGPHGAGDVLRFTPRSPRGEVQLRAIFLGGASGDVWFDDASLRPAFRYAWSLDGTLVGDDSPLVDVALDRGVPHALEVAIADAAGNVGRGRATVPPGAALDPVPIEARGAPAVGRVGAPVELDLSASWDGSFDALAHPTPWAGWGTEDGEAPGHVVVARGANGSMAVRYLDADASFGAGIQRVLDAPPHPQGSDLVVHYRTEGAIERVQLLARYHRGGAPDYVEYRTNASPSPNGSVAWLRIPPAPPDHTLVLLGLRALVKEGAPGLLELSNASFAPAFSYMWSLPDQQGPVGQLLADEPGLRAWRVRVETPGGSAWNASGTVGFLPTTDPYPTLTAGVRATWNATWLPPGARVRLEGPASAVAEGAAGAVATSTFLPGRYEAWGESAGGARVLLGNATFADRSGLATTEWSGARGANVPFRFALPDRDLANATLVLASGLREARVPLARGAQGWSGNWTVPAAWLPGSTRLALDLEESGGSRARIEAGSLDVGVAPGASAAWLPIALLGVGVIVAWRPRLAAGGAFLARRVGVGFAAGAAGGAIASLLVRPGADATFAAFGLLGVSFAAGAAASRRAWVGPLLGAAMLVAFGLVRPEAPLALLVAAWALATGGFLGARRWAR